MNLEAFIQCVYVPFNVCIIFGAFINVDKKIKKICVMNIILGFHGDWLTVQEDMFAICRIP